MGERIVVLVTDAFGGRGGIALYNRHFLRAVCSHPDVNEVVALPRVISYALEPMPANLRFETWSTGSKLRYGQAVAALAARPGSAALVVCSHLSLLPFAHVLSTRYRCPTLPLVYGIEAWSSYPNAMVSALTRRIKVFVSIRKLTAERLRRWAGIPDARFHYLPNCIDLASFGPGLKRLDLVAKYGLAGRTVVMTAGRLDDTIYERNKGFEEVLGALPGLAEEVPDVTYLVMGDGNHRPRLEGIARTLGVANRVVFSGYVPEADKADHYRLADVVAMPGSNPVFDRYPYRFAFLEPLACGVPVVGARLDEPSERDDPDAARLVIQVDPNDAADIRRGIREGLARRRDGVDPLLKKFSFPAFEKSAHAILSAEMRAR